MALLVAFVPQAFTAISFEERHRIDRAGNPPDLAFLLKTTNGQKQFHPGEVIGITLEFSSGVPAKYRLNGATYDRSGRLPTEEFVLDRDDAADPLIDYFGSGVIGGIAGGLRSYPTLEPEPYQIDLFLNDWFRFDKPGRYRMYLKSHRLSRESVPPEPGEGLVNFAAVSNIVEIEILNADPAWEAAKLAELTAILDPPDRAAIERPRPTAANGLNPPDIKRIVPTAEVIRAKKELQFLGTSGAVLLILKLARRDPEELDSFGLIGSSRRQLVVAELDQYIRDPDTRVSQWIVRLRVLFDYVSKGSPRPIPIYVWQQERADWKKLRSELDARGTEFEGMVRQGAAELIPLVSRKSASVREEFVETLTALAPDEAKAAGIVPPADYGMSRDQLIAQFSRLSEERQSALLCEKWGSVRSPGMLPILRQMVERTEPGPLPKSAIAYSLWHGAGRLPEKALERMREYAPDEVRQILLDDITRPQPRFPEFAVHELSAQDIPKADSGMAENFKANPAGTVPLIAKFASIALVDPVRSAYERTRWPCEEEKWFVAYFVRLLPGKEPGAGKDVLAQAMNARENRGCFRKLLPDVARIIWNSTVEQQAIATLDDPDSEAAGSAARVLASHGGAGVENLLWRRLEEWSKKWMGREQELRRHPVTGADPNSGERILGEALFDAIARARAWYLDDERSGRLVALCINDWCRQQWTPSSTDSPGLFHVDASNGGGIYGQVFNLRQYRLTSLKELKEKMAQFPVGSEFLWCPHADDLFDGFIPEERQEMYEELVQFLAKRLMRIEPYSREACSPH